MLKKKDRNIKIAFTASNKLNNLISNRMGKPVQTAKNSTQEEPTGISKPGSKNIEEISYAWKENKNSQITSYTKDIKWKILKK